MLNNNKKTSGPDDLFNRQKLAEEAKRETEKAKQIQKQKDKNQIQIKIDNLKHELATVEIELKGKESKLFSAKRDVDAFNRELTQEKTNIQREENSINSTQRQTSSNLDTSLKSELGKTTQKIDQTKKAADLLEADNREKKNELDNLNRKVTSLQNEIASMTSLVQHTKSEISELEKKANGKIEIDNLNKKIAALQNEINLLLSSIQRIKNESSESERKILEKKSEQTRLEAELRKLEIGTEQTQNMKQHINSEISKIENKLKENKIEQTRLEAELRKLETDIKQAEQKMVSEKKESEKETLKVKQLKSEETNQERKFKKAEEDKKTIEEEIRKITSDITQKKNEIDRLTREMNQIK